METLNALATLLGNGFFPIIVCIISTVFAYLIKEMNANHKEEITELRKSIDNNTLVVQKLVDKMDGE